MVFAIIGAMRCLSVVLHNTNILNLSLRLKARDFPPDRDINIDKSFMTIFALRVIKVKQ